MSGCASNSDKLRVTHYKWGQVTESCVWSKKTCDGEEQGKSDPKKLVKAPHRGRPGQVKKRGSRGSDQESFLSPPSPPTSPPAPPPKPPVTETCDKQQPACL